MNTSHTDREILYHFAMEDDHRAALPRYQADYPEHAEALAELAADIDRDPEDEPEGMLTAEDYRMIDLSWERVRRSMLLPQRW